MILRPTQNICSNMDIISIYGIYILDEFSHISCKDNIVLHQKIVLIF